MNYQNRDEYCDAIKKAKETAKALSQEGMPVQKIAQILGEEGEIVRNWLEEEK